MEARIEAIENDLAALKADVAAIRAHHATEEALIALRVDLADFRSTYLTREYLHEELNKSTWRMFGVFSVLTAVVYYIARYVH